MNRDEIAFTARLAIRKRLGSLFGAVCMLSTWFCIATLAVLVGGVLWQSVGWVDWQFLTSFDSRHPAEAGVFAALCGSLWLMFFATLFSVPIGVGAAVYLEEYARDTRATRLIRMNLANLAGVPSIVYGILGLTVFVRMFGLFQSQPKILAVPLLGIEIPVPLGRSVIAGALTLGLLILPVIIVAAQEALRAVPASIRHTSYALGATHWQTIRHQVLPAATPGILTGVILALSRAMGETAPLVMIGALSYVAFTPGDINSPMDVLNHPERLAEAPFASFTALPLQIFNWISHPQEEYQHVAAAGIVVLLGVLLVMNGAAVILRQRLARANRG